MVTAAAVIVDAEKKQAKKEKLRLDSWRQTYVDFTSLCESNAFFIWFSNAGVKNTHAWLKFAVFRLNIAKIYPVTWAENFD